VLAVPSTARPAPDLGSTVDSSVPAGGHDGPSRQSPALLVSVVVTAPDQPAGASLSQVGDAGPQPASGIDARALEQRLLLGQARDTLVGLTGCSQERAVAALTTVAMFLDLERVDIARHFLSGTVRPSGQMGGAMVTTLTAVARAPQASRGTGGLEAPRGAAGAVVAPDGGHQRAAAPARPGSEAMAPLIRLRSTSRPVGGPIVLTVSGELDLSTGPELAAAITGAIGSGADSTHGGDVFLLALEGLTFIDTAGLSTLASAPARVRDAGMTFAVALPTARAPRRVIALATAHSWLPSAFEDGISARRHASR